jgi:RNA polymerase primary sigma factor
MYSEHLKIYLDQINRIPRITKEEEKDLIAKAKNGDQKAKDKLIKSHLRFVYFIAKKYFRSNIDMLEMINEGNIGLIEAFDSYDPDRGVMFLSWAVNSIRRNILLVLERSYITTTRTGISKEKAPKIKIREKGKTPLSDKICALDMTIAESKYSIDTRENVELNCVDRKILPSLLNSALNFLPDPRQKKIIELHFGLNNEEPHTLLEIGKKFKLSKERVRQLEEKAIYYLTRKSVFRKELKEFTKEAV